MKSLNANLPKAKAQSRLRRCARVQSALLGYGLAGLTLLVGCSKSGTSAPGTNTIAMWSWGGYPKVNKMRLGLLHGSVLPKTSFSITAPMAGPLHIYVEQAQTNLPAGFVWAEFEPKILAAEGVALEDAKTRAAEKERLMLDLDLPGQRLKLETEIETAKRQLAFLELLAAHPEIAPTAASLAGIKDKEAALKPETLARVREEIRLMEKKYKYICQTNTAVLSGDLLAQQSELQRRELDLERRQNQLRFTMPFAGQLNTSLPLVQGVSEYPVNLGQELGVVRDLSTILLRLPLAEPAWTSLPVASLNALVNLPDGTRLEAPFLYKRLERNQLREEIAYYFELPKEKLASAVQLVGAEVSCELWLGLSQPAHVVPKLALVLQAPAAFENRNWEAGLSQVSPGAHLLVEGQTDLAITTP